MRAEDQKAFAMVFGRSPASLNEARIDSLAASVIATLRLAAMSDSAEFDRLIAAVNEQVGTTARKLGAV